MTQSIIRDQDGMLAFVLIPFDPEFNRIYSDLIVPALEDAGYEVLRADSVVDQRSILRDVIDNIIQADLIVADLSSVNGNVMYELGIAHGLAKPTVLLTQDIAAVPFDLRSYRLITYTLNYGDAKKLQDQLSEIARRHREGTIRFGNPVSDFAPQEFREERATSREVIKNTSSTTSPPETSEVFGILDFEANIEEAQTAIVGSLERLTTASNNLQKDITPHTMEMNRIANAPGNNARKRELARLVAQEIVNYAESLQSEIPTLDTAWQQFGESTEGIAALGAIATEADVQAARALIDSASQFEQAILGVIPQIDEAKSSLNQIASISKDLNRAARQARHAFDGILGSFNIGAAAVGRVISIIQERLDAMENADVRFVVPGQN